METEQEFWAAYCLLFEKQQILKPAVEGEIEFLVRAAEVTGLGTRNLVRLWAERLRDRNNTGGNTHD